MKIFKYELDIDDLVLLPLPQGAQILTVQIQGPLICLWAIVDPKAKVCQRRLLWRGTGHELGEAERGAYVGTVLARGGSLVLHLFDLGEAP